MRCGAGHLVTSGQRSVRNSVILATVLFARAPAHFGSALGTDQLGMLYEPWFL